MIGQIKAEKVIAANDINSAVMAIVLSYGLVAVFRRS